jgi:hypothetical protein
MDLTHALLAQDRLADAAAAIAELDARPIPCDVEWVIRRHMARALLAARTGEPERGVQDARAAIAAAQRTSLIVARADALRTQAELLTATGHTSAAADALRRALSLYEAKAHTVAIASTRAQLAQLAAGAAAS